MREAGLAATEPPTDTILVEPTGRRRLSARAVDAAWRLAYRVGFPLARLWWTATRPAHEGALVAIHAAGCLLLVRSSYRRRWNFPGGGVKRGEAPADAARRELLEEIGLTAPTLGAATVYEGVWDGRPDRVHVYDLRLDPPVRVRLDRREIVEVRLVPLAGLRRLPLTGPVAAYVRRYLATGSTA